MKIHCGMKQIGFCRNPPFLYKYEKVCESNGAWPSPAESDMESTGAYATWNWPGSCMPMSQMLHHLLNMHPDLSSHLHIEECNALINLLKECHEHHSILKKFFKDFI